MATGEQSSCDGFPEGQGSDLIQAGDCSDGNCAAAVSVPYAALQACGQTVEIHLAGASYWFNQGSDGSYGLSYPAEATASLAVSDAALSFQARGETWNFHGFGQDIYPKGALDSVARGGRTYTVGYNTSSGPDSNGVPSGKVTQVAQTGGPENYQFDYNTGGLLTAVTLTRQLTGQALQPVARLAVSYFSSTGSYAAAGDLESRQAEVYDAPTGQWVAQSGKHYGYDPVTGLIRFVLDRRQYDQLLADQGVAAGGDLNSIAAADAIARYAREAYAYDGEGRIVTQGLDGGARVYSFQYGLNSSPSYVDGYSNWKYRTTETLRDAVGNVIHVKEVYMNFVGALLLSQLTADGKNWLEYKAYNAAGQATLHAQPSALAGFTLGDLTIEPHYGVAGGLVRCYQYYTAADVTANPATAETAGAVLGYLNYEQLQQGGDSSTLINLRQLAYLVRSGSGIATLYPVGTVTEYADGGRPITTSYAYDWYDGTAQMSRRVTTLPVVSASQNGSDTAATRAEYFDLQGKLTWRMDELGRVSYRQYDTLTEALVQAIEDCKSSLLTVTPPSTLTVPGDGLHLVTDITVDVLGRAIEVLGPSHEAVNPAGGTALTVRTGQWTLFDDVNRRVVSAQGYEDMSNNTITLVNPVALTLRDAYNRTSDEIQAAATATATVTNHALVVTDPIAQTTWCRWTHREYYDAASNGRLKATRVYHVIPASGTGGEGPELNYNRSEIGYDALYRVNRSVAADGTISRTLFDALGRTVRSYVGTCDARATDADPTAAMACELQGNNLVLVSSQEYDYGQAGDGNLTRTTLYVDGTGALDRVTEYRYDWRNRRTAILGPEGSCAVSLYDNLNRVICTERHEGTPEGTLLSHEESAYDDRGRVYLSKVYEVDPASGVLGQALAANTWYDDAGNVIKQQAAGAQTFVKTTHDGLGRPVTRYTGYDPATETYAQVGSVDSNDTIFAQVETEYDGAGHAIQVTNWARFHDATASGALSSDTARVTQSGVWYDGIGRQVAVADYGTGSFTRPNQPVPSPSGTVLVTSTGYDAAGQAFQTIDPAAREDRREFDQAGRVVRTMQNYVEGGTAADQNITVETTYTAGSQVRTLTAVNPTTGDQVTQYIYGTAVGCEHPQIFRNDLLRAVIYPDSGDPADLRSGVYDRMEYWYNRQGERIGVKDQNGTVHEYLFDGLGRQVQDKVTTVGTGIDTAVLRLDRGYNRRGLLERLTSYAEPAGETTVNEVRRQYNGLDMLLQEYQEHGGAVNANSLSVAYGYDTTNDGTLYTKGLRPTALTYPNGRQVTYTYGGTGSASDLLDRLDAISDGSGMLAQYGYLGLGAIVMESYPQPGVSLDYTANNYAGFDPFGRIAQQPWKTSGGTLDQFNYGYDPAGNRLYRQNAVGSQKDELYGYDRVDRLTTSQRGTLNLSGTSPAITGTPVREEDWTLDATGNWSEYMQKVSGNVTLDQNRTSNAANELQTIANGGTATLRYDRAGNTLSLPKPGDSSLTLTCTWDAWNRLVATSDGTLAAAYAYDALGRRIHKSTSATATHYYLASQQVVETRLTPSGGTAAGQYQYVWSPRYIDAPVLRDDATTGAAYPRLYYLNDANFNVTSLAGTNGTVVERYVYDAYGAAMFYDAAWSAPSTTSAVGNAVLYTGRELDAETGLYYYRARYYSPDLGRFLGRDPIQSDLNLYRYGYDNPSNLDPSGLKATATFCPGKGLFNSVQVGSYGTVLKPTPGDVGADFLAEWTPSTAAFSNPPGTLPRQCCDEIGWIQVVKGTATWTGPLAFLHSSEDNFNWKVDGGIPYPGATGPGNKLPRSGDPLTLTTSIGIGDQPENPSTPFGATLQSETKEFETCVVCLKGQQKIKFGTCVYFGGSFLSLENITVYGCIHWSYQLSRTPAGGYTQTITLEGKTLTGPTAVLPLAGVQGTGPTQNFVDAVSDHEFSPSITLN